MRLGEHWQLLGVEKMRPVFKVQTDSESQASTVTDDAVAYQLSIPYGSTLPPDLEYQHSG
jgi:hypothetical protein